MVMFECKDEKYEPLKVEYVMARYNSIYSRINI